MYPWYENRRQQNARMTQAALCNQKYGKYGATLIQTGIFHKR